MKSITAVEGRRAEALATGGASVDGASGPLVAVKNEAEPEAESAKGAPARSLAGDWGVLGADLRFGEGGVEAAVGVEFEAASRAGGCPRSEVGNSEGRRQKGGPERPPLRISELEENLLGLLARAREEAVVDLEGEGAQAGAVMPGDVSAALEHGSHCDDFPGGIGADIRE